MRSEESHRSDIGSPIPSARPTSPEAPPTRHVPDDSAAFDIQDVLHGFAKDPASASVDNVLAARSIVANSILSPDWHAALADEARAVYNLCLQKQVANRQDIMLATTHMRALCLALTEASKEVAPACDMDRGMHAKHWARTGLQFVILGEVDEAQRSLDASSARLRDFDDAHSVELLECELHLCGYRAHLAWRRDDFKQVLKHVEEAHTLLEERGGTQWILASSRQYLSEHVALRLARRSFEISEEGGASSAGGTGVVAADGADAADGVASAGVERREQLRLLDLALAVLGSNAASTDALDEIDLASLRDRILRLRAWLCMLEDEIDAATHSLQQHSNATSPEYMMLRCALLFRSNQPSAASALTVDWLREQTDLPHDVASDAIKLLTDSQAHASALVAANLLSERLARSDDLSAPCAGGTSTLGAEYSDLQEVKYRLLTESVPDQAAAEEHLELVLDGHCSGRLPLEELTLRGFASKLWASGCEKYAHGDLHRTVGDFERAFRFLEHTRQRASQARAQSTLGHMYLQQDRLEQAVDRASNCLKLIPQRRAGESDALDALDALSGAPGSGADDTDDWDTSQSLAMITLVKAKIKQGDAAAAHAQIDALLTRHPDHLLLAAICEELASLGSAYHAASIQILESFVNRLAELPVHAGGAGGVGGVGEGDTSTSPPPRPERASASAEKLAAATRSLVSLRIQAAAAQDKEGGEAGGASQRSMRTALLTDLQAIARRLARDGAAVCDDPAHIEWLADQAWHLAWVEGQRVPAELGESSVSGSDEHESQTLRFCADFVEASADLTAALPATEARLGLMRSAQLVICRAALRLAAAKPISETAEREHLTRAAKAMDAAFRLHQRYSHACRCECSLAEVLTDAAPRALRACHAPLAFSPR